MELSNDERYMARCITLARLGAGFVAPNPMVGAVLVHGETIIGEGYHQQYGLAHAEVNCISDAASKHAASLEPGKATFETILAQSVLYVSLEPCAHFGKTPPCADLIISKKIPKVVVGCRDPFPLVDGKGIEKLRAAGIEVTLGVLEESCRELNKRFFTFHLHRRPYIILKWAQSADCKISAVNQQVQISNEFTNRLVHRWRSEEVSIIVGPNTVVVDNPALTNRLWTGNNPVRILLDMHLRLDPSAKVFDGTVRTIIFNASKHTIEGNLEYYKLNPRLSLALQIADALYLLNVQGVLIEGGSRLLQTFIDANLWDEARVITNNTLIIGDGIPAPTWKGGRLTENYTILSDSIYYYQNA